MLFDRSGEVRPDIEEACNSCVVLGEDLDDCWQTKDIWVGLMTESFHVGSIGITGDEKSLLFELLWLLLRHWLSRGVLCENLDDSWQTEDIWGGLMNELFNGRETGITSNYNSLIFEWQSLRLKTRLSQGVVCRLSWLFPVTLLWHLRRPFLERGTMNAIRVCVDIVCLLFCLSMAIIRREPIFWRDNCILVCIYVPGIKIDYELFVSKSS